MTRRLPAWLAAGALLTLTAGCDQLGNPPLEEGRTGAELWQSPIVDLGTRTETVPAARSDELFRSVPGGAVHHLERPLAGVATLVVVEPRWRRPVPPGLVPLVTELVLADGTVVRKRWAAPSTARTWFAVFALPSPPRQAFTALSG